MLYWFKTGFNLDFAVTEPFTLITGAATDGKSPAVFRGGIVQLDPVGIQTVLIHDRTGIGRLELIDSQTTFLRVT